MVGSRRLRMAVAAGVMFLGIMATPVAMAQQETEEEKAAKWSDVPKLEHAKPWKQWLAGTLFAIGCLVAAFKNPHRTHLD